MFFIQGLRLGLMPLAEGVGNLLPQRSLLLTILLFNFAIGYGATLAEPAIGLKAGDIIVELNGVPIESNNHLVHIVADVRPDETVPVKFFRDGELRTSDVTMALRTVDAAIEPEEPTEDRGRLGISGQNLSDELASELGASSSAGVVLMDVDPNGPAEDGGLRRGDIIIEANRQPVRNVDDLQRLIGEVPAGGDLLLRIERIVRGQQSSFLWIPVQLE